MKPLEEIVDLAGNCRAADGRAGGGVPRRSRQPIFGKGGPVPPRVVTILLAATIAAACGRAKPQTTAAPQPNVDSMAAADKARQDSSAALRRIEEERARIAHERLAEPQRADSLAAVRRKREELEAIVAETIHFEFDKANIRPADARVLDQKLPILRAHPAMRIRIAGDCDERGSDEYNLALGNRRAISAKEYLVNYGIDADRIATISYGKERPIDPGHSEAAWAKNRNDEFEIVTGDVVVKP